MKMYYFTTPWRLTVIQLIKFFFLQGDLNVGGIVAGVIVVLLLLILLGLGIWYANKKGYLPSEFSTFILLLIEISVIINSVLTLPETLDLQIVGLLSIKLIQTVESNLKEFLFF